MKLGRKNDFNVNTTGCGLPTSHKTAETSTFEYRYSKQTYL